VLKKQCFITATLVLSQSCCFRSIRWRCLRSCWMVLSHATRGHPGCLLQSAGGEANSVLLASALSSMRAMCPNIVSQHDWIIAVSLGSFVSLYTSPLRTNWYHLMPASILHASIFDIAQQSKPYKNIGKTYVLYSFNFVAIASCDLQIWFLGYAWQHEWWHFSSWCHKCFQLLSE